MPQVPYSPVPGEGPSGLNPAVSRLGYTPSIHVNPPIEAFGGATGRAQERLGGAIEQVGGALSDIALHRQAIENTASTNDLAVQAEIEIGALKTEGYSKEGKAAIDFSNEFGTRVQAIREKYLNQAPNAAVGRDLDNALRRSVGYALINWGQHVATQEKAYARQGAEARIGVATQAALGASESELNSRIEEAKASARYLTRDAPAETQKLAVDKAESDIRAARLNYDAVTDARGALNSYRKNIDKILPSDRKALEDQLFRAAGVHGAAQIANQAVSPGPQTLKDLIAKHETGSSGPESYDVVYNHGQDFPPPKPVTQMTLNEILSYQQRGKKLAGSPAFPVGRYQIIQSTLSDLINSMELTGNEKFTPAMQERMANQLIARRGGDVEGLREEWTSLKQVTAGEIKAAARGPSTSQGRGTEAQVVERAKQIAATYIPADVFGKERADEFMDKAVGATLTRFGVDVKIERDAQFGATQTVYAAMIDDKYNTLDEAVKGDPEVSKAFASLPATVQDSVRRHFEIKAKRADNQETQEQRDRYEDLLGRSFLNPKEFLDADLAREDLSKKGTGKLLTRRDHIFKSIVDEVKMNPIISELRASGMFEGLDFKEKEGQNNVRLQKFVGALHTLIMDDKAATGKMPDIDRQKQLAAQLIKTKTGYFGLDFLGGGKGLDEEAAEKLIGQGPALQKFQREYQASFPGKTLPPLSWQLNFIRTHKASE